MNRIFIALLALLGLSAITAQPARPQTPETAQASVMQQSVPRLVQFNGTLKDAWARPMSGVESVTFAIYGEQEGGTALWSETQNVIAESNFDFVARQDSLVFNRSLLLRKRHKKSKSRLVGITGQVHFERIPLVR